MAVGGGKAGEECWRSLIQLKLHPTSSTHFLFILHDSPVVALIHIYGCRIKTAVFVGSLQKKSQKGP